MPYWEKIQHIASQMEKESVMILMAPPAKIRNRDVHFEYRTSSDLLYLTGLNLDSFSLILNHDSSLTIFMKYPDPAIERWTGKMTTVESVSNIFRINKDQVKNQKELWNELPEILKNKRIIYLDLAIEKDNINKIIAIANDLNKNSRDSTYGPVTITHAGSILHEERIFKSTDELEKIHKAIEITGTGFIDVMRYTRKRTNNIMFEYQVKARIEQTFMEFGSQSLAYPTIVASGNNANYLHYESCSELIKPDGLILIDAGCEWQGYASDITRTFPANGKFTSEQKEIYSLVLEAQKEAISVCSQMSTFENMHQKAVETIVQGLWDMKLFNEIFDSVDGKMTRIKPGSIEEIIEKKYYRLFYMHYTSHYMGLDVHDVGNYYSEGKSRNFQQGMVFTVEPGIYIRNDYEFIPEKFRGIGIRIEDNLLIGEKGIDVLSSNIPKEILEIESLG